MDPRGLLPPNLEAIAAEWLAHDIPSFDIGGAVVGRRIAQSRFLAKSEMVVAGYPFVEAIFEQLGCKVTWEVQEGTLVKGSSAQRIPLGVVEGPVNRLLQGERTALEVLTRCSACAYYTRKAQEAAGRWSGKVAATRKTTPGAFRLVEKYGVLLGGGDTHRYSMSTMTMLKDNHIDAAGSITKAVQAAKRFGGFSLKVEVEARSEAEAEEACRAGADVVMLDNFTPSHLREVAPRLKSKYPHVILEVSGGITHATVKDYAVEGIDILSMGCLTHGTPAVDISLKIVKDSKL